MTDGYVQVPPDSSGKKIDTTELQTTVGTVERQRVAIPDGVDVSGDILTQILVEQRVQNLLLCEAFSIADDLDELRDDVSVSETLMPLATGNLTFAVPGQYSTITAAVLAASGFNYQNLYAPTITVAAGTYNEQVVLPALLNCNASGGTINFASGVTVKDLGTGWTFTAINGGSWVFTGSKITLSGSYGGIFVDPNANFYNQVGLTFSGSFSQGGIFVDACGVYVGVNSNVNTTTAAMGTLFNTKGYLIFDGATITFTNSISITGYLVRQDSVTAFFAMQSGSFVNASNVTTSLNCLAMTNRATFEAGVFISAQTTVDGVNMTRANFPGVIHGSSVSVDSSCVFQPDYLYSTNTLLGAGAPGASDTGTIQIWDGAGNLRLDYHKTAPGDIWTVTSVLFQVKAPGPQIGFTDTQTNGHSWIFGAAVASAVSYVFLEDLTASGQPTPWALNFDNIGSSQLRSGAVRGWSSNATFADGAAMDTGLSRIAPVSSVPTIAIGNGTAADASGTIKAKTKAGAFAASDIPAGTWILGRDTSGATTKLYYNNAGTLMTVALV